MPSSSLIPDDPSVLLTTAGMQQFKQYYTKPELAPAKNIASIQKSMRTSDIDEVGDESHLTFFEMLGNFSFGFVEGSRAKPGIAVGYGKEEAIKYAYEFITKEMGLKIDYVSVFGHDADIPADEESQKIWKSVDSSLEIKKEGRKDNFWGPTGLEGPCGPTTEIYVNGIEIWNIVFNEYYCGSDGSMKKLENLGVDTGMGLERLAAVVQKKKSIFETDLFAPLLEKLKPASFSDRIKRITADHSRAMAFLISDGIKPSNKDRGYILRRIIRRVITYGYMENIKRPPEDIFKTIVNGYRDIYKNLDYSDIIKVYSEEYERFIKTLESGLKELEKLASVDAESAFRLYESFGLPYEIIREFSKDRAMNLTREAFDEEFKKHQDKSRAWVLKKFQK